MRSDIEPIRELFTKPTSAEFTVPEYQRGFEWEREQFEDLWNDIQRIGNRVDRHFLGNIILLQRGESLELEIVDGQQRMTTISVLMMAIRDHKKIDPEKYPEIEYILTTRRSKETKRKIHLYDSTADQSFDRLWNGNTKNVDGSIGTAYEYFSDQIEEFSQREIEDLITTVVEDLQVVRTKAEEPGLAYMIFQSQNERGVEVEPEILIKARIFGEADRLDEELESRRMKDQWKEIYQMLRGNLGSPRFRNHLSVRRPITQILINSDSPTPNIFDSSQLYKRFDEALQESPDVTEFVDTFHDKVENYLKIASSDYDINHPDLSDEMQRYLQYLNAASSHSENLTIAILKNTDDDRVIREALKLAATLVTRMLLADYDTTDRKKAIHSAAGMINDGESIEQAIKRLISRVGPEDSEIIEHLSSNSLVVRGQWRFRTLLKLTAIEERRQPALRTDLDELAIEHIAPINTFGSNNRGGRDFTSWRRAIGNKRRFEDQNERHKLGNLTLLTSTDHNRVNESSFEDKRGVYQNSGFLLTEEIHNEYEEWNLSTIQDRTDMLAEELTRIWST